MRIIGLATGQHRGGVVDGARAALENRIYPFSKILFFSRYALCRSAISTDIDKRKFEIPFLKGIFRSFKTNFPSLDSVNSTETYSSPLLSDLWIHVSRVISAKLFETSIVVAYSTRKAEEYRADPFDPIPAQTRKNATFIAFLNGSPWEGESIFLVLRRAACQIVSPK